MKFNGKPYELDPIFDHIFNRCRIRLKILLIVYDFPGITDRDVITLVPLPNKKRRDIIKELIDNKVIIARDFGISKRLWINEENPMVSGLIKYMKENDYYSSI